MRDTPPILYERLKTLSTQQLSPPVQQANRTPPVRDGFRAKQLNPNTMEVVVRAVSKKETGTYVIVQEEESAEGIFAIGGASYNMKLTADAEVTEGETLDLSQFKVTAEEPSTPFWTNANGEQVRNRPWLRLSKA